MDGECAFCGRADAATTNQLYCDDCHSEHRVCRECAAEASVEAAQLGLAELPQAA